MSDRTVATRYAGALYEEAEQQDIVEEIDEDVALIRESLDGSRELVNFFNSPVIGREKKERIVRELFAERVEPLTLHFLLLLVKKKRETLVLNMIRAYRRLRDEQLEITEALVRVPSALDEQERKHLKGRLETMTGRQVRLQVREDPDLVGGLVVRIGDTVYDGSVQHQLESLRERMEQHGLDNALGDGAPVSAS